MNKEKAKSVLKAYGSPKFKMKGSDTVIVFSRQTEEDIAEIEKKNDKELVELWKSLTFNTYIYGQVSLSDMQRIDLIELEFEDRKDINQDELKVWYEKTNNEFLESIGE